jgi:hypothetical protein
MFKGNNYEIAKRSKNQLVYAASGTVSFHDQDLTAVATDPANNNFWLCGLTVRNIYQHDTHHSSRMDI